MDAEIPMEIVNSLNEMIQESALALLKKCKTVDVPAVNSVIGNV